jgi:ectoine hydroxylase-related dioxygenase (phytanoyl-CoA dioxygenase family)
MTMRFTTCFLSLYVLLASVAVIGAATRERVQSSDGNAVQNYFDQMGFVVLRNFFPQELLDDWVQAAPEAFQDIFQRLYDNGHTKFPEHSLKRRSGTREYALGGGTEKGFQEIVMRSPGRYEISMHNPGLPTVDPLVEKLAAIVPGLLHFPGEIDALNRDMTLIVSTPEARVQSWHTDGDHAHMLDHTPAHVLNVVIPLVNVTMDMGPTELIPASHFYTRQPSPMQIDTTQLQNPFAPTLNVGDILVWDYRVLHRGLPNRSEKNRPMLTLTFSHPWFTDTKNWPADRKISDKCLSDQCANK